MPSQNSPFPISGRMGGHIYYYRKDRKNRKHYFIRQAPGIVRQTPATKRAATDFGTASKSSSLLRKALHQYTRSCYDNSLHFRLNKKMGEIVRADVNHPSGQRTLIAANIQSLRDFQFNSATSIPQLLKSTPVIEKSDTGDISISFSGTFNHRSNTTHIAIKAIGLSVNFAQETTRQQESNTVVIKRGEKHTPVTLTMNMNSKDITLILLEVQSCYEVNGQLHLSQNRQGHALDVMAVFPPVEKLVELKRKYRNKAPRFWIPSAAPARGALMILPVNAISLPEG